VKDGQQTFVLKMNGSGRKFPHVQTDGEKCISLALKCPQILLDLSLTFPVMLLKCCENNGNELYDLFVMREAPGVRITDAIAFYVRQCSEHLDELIDMFRRFGAFLADYHSAYQMQHGDCHASNIFYDSVNFRFTIVDVADMCEDPYGAENDDVNYFNEALMMLSEYYGADLMAQSCSAVTAGYKARLSLFQASAAHANDMGEVPAVRGRDFIEAPVVQRRDTIEEPGLHRPSGSISPDCVTQFSTGEEAKENSVPRANSRSMFRNLFSQ